MLSEKEMRRIARDECVAMLGKELVYKHKDLCCAAYGTMSDGLFHYTLGMDTEDITDWHIGGNTPMEYYAFVVVDPNTGKVSRDYKSSTLPNT